MIDVNVHGLFDLQRTLAGERGDDTARRLRRSIGAVRTFGSSRGNRMTTSAINAASVMFFAEKLTELEASTNRNKIATRADGSDRRNNSTTKQVSPTVMTAVPTRPYWTMQASQKLSMP